MRRRLLLLLGGQTVALGLTVSFLVVPASALFLHEYGAGALAYAYLVVAVAGAAVSSALTVAQRRMPLGRLALVTLLVHVVVVLAAWVLLTQWGLAWVTFVLIVLFPLSIPTGFLLVGSQAVRLYDVQLLKRDFPRIVAGFSVGFAVGGLAAAALVAPLGGADHLLLVDVAMALLMTAMVAATCRSFPGELLTPPTETNPPARRSRPRTAGRMDVQRLLRDPLVRLVLGYQVLSAAVTQLLDFVVWERAAAYYPDPSHLARFMGAFGAIINIVSILFVVLLAGRLLTRRGVGFGLAANPVGVIVVCILAVAVSLGPGIVTFAYLATVGAAQVTDIALTDGTTRTAIATTYSGVRPADRLRVQTLVEGAGVPLAVGLVGAYLLLMRAVGLDVRAIVVTVLALSALWWWLGRRAHASYGAHVGDVLDERAWDPAAVRLDAPTLAAVNRLAASTDPVDRHTAYDLLVDVASPEAAQAAAGGLSHDDPEVRARAIEAVVAGGAQGTTVAGALRGVALSSARRVGRSATAGTPQPPPQAVASVRSLVGDPDAGVRARAAAVVAAADPDGLTDGLLVWQSVLGDPETTAQALAAATAFPSPGLVPALLALVERTPSPDGLAGALTAHGSLLVDELRARLADSRPGPGLAAVARAVGESGDDRGRRVLVAALGDDRTDVSDIALGALSRAQAGRPGRGVDRGVRRTLDMVVGRELARIAAIRSLRGALAVGAEPDRAGAEGLGPGLEALTGALADEQERAIHRVLAFGGVIVPGLTPERLLARLSAPDDATRALARELVDVSFGRRAAQVVAAVCTGVDEAAPDVSGPLLVADLARGLPVAGLQPDPWLQACALRALPELAPDVVGDVARHLDPVQHLDAVGQPDDPYARRSEPALVEALSETRAWLAQLPGSRESLRAASASAEADRP